MRAIKVLIKTWQIVVRLPLAFAVKTFKSFKTIYCHRCLLNIRHVISVWRISPASLLHHILSTCYWRNYLIDCKAGDKKKQVTYLLIWHHVLFITAFRTRIYVLLIYIISRLFLVSIHFFLSGDESESCRVLFRNLQENGSSFSISSCV